ncbi:SUKH-4 family immunity protein [Streptacidiphilus sp. EB129]|uniref:SUKH-4 family immunity protein n=1 Tax=Streptacidiphilus sp. EB129 TaxID=3156262 RepID=UPI003517F81D
MATTQELTELFGADRIARVDREECLRFGVPEAAVTALSETGVPAFVDVLFTLTVQGEPVAFDLLPVEVGAEQVKVLVLGGPTDDPGLRYCLDLERGVVILLALGAEPQAEIVNSSLETFVEFLYRMGLRGAHTAQADAPQQHEYYQKLADYLRAVDPVAFAEPDSWWSAVFEQLTA